jgi:glycosyltransferase involved in cell wall biosynthesis
VGLGSEYDLEQTTFAMKLWPRIRRDFDILHVQDPWLAFIMERLHRMKLSRPRVILAHGTEESAAFLRRFSNLQHLAPCYLDDWASEKPNGQKAFGIGNFVDIETFAPGDRATARREFDLPADDLIVLCVAAIKRKHKRVDYLLHEFASFAERHERPATLVVAGAREPDTDAVVALGRELLGDRVRFLEGVGRDRMPLLYRSADIFALASLHEMMPIALLEALASGLPIACNRTPTLQWMAGPEIPLVDISGAGALSDQLIYLAHPSRVTALSLAARRHAETTFSEQVVVNQLLEMYSQVMEGGR